MKTIRIGGIEFEYITHIEPERDVSGNIIEEFPAPRYVNRKSLPLNEYGDGPFCRFRVRIDKSLDTFGVYAVSDEGNCVLYIGKCTGLTSTLAKRFNNGYGTISPRNCYQGGQSTNCRINYLVLDAVKSGKKLAILFHETVSGHDATSLEADLIRRIGKPPWNLQEPWGLTG